MQYSIFQISSRKLFSFGIMAIVVGSTLGGVLWYFGGTYLFEQHELRRFSSYQELVDFLKMKPQETPQSLFQRFFQRFVSQPRSLSQIDVLAESGGSLDYKYSSTNIQVEGVDEADIVKTDGRYLYVVSQSFVYIIDAVPAESAQVLFKLDLETTIVGIFVNDDKLVVFQNRDGYEIASTRFPYFGSSKTMITIYDLSNKSNPVFERNVTVDGYYFSSRMIGDYVYVLANNPVYLINNSQVILPEVSFDNTNVKIEASSIYYTELPEYYYHFTNILSINIKDATQSPKVESFLLGATSCIYVSRENIYVTTYGTNIYKIRIKNGEMTLIASGIVSGYVLNQFFMDEYEGNFRIITSDGHSNNVYVLNEELAIIGKLEGLALNEDPYAARFEGDICYLVTFMKVDPLFVIDLKDPTNHKVLGELKISGYSAYLHRYDQDHLIGIGKEAIEAGINFGLYQGIKIALFDVSNWSQPKVVDDPIVIGHRGTETPVLNDHKAFLFSRSNDLLVIPILLAEIDKEQYPNEVPPETYGAPIWQGAYVFNITLNEVFIRGRVTHVEDSTSSIGYSSPYFVKRSLYIGSVLYTISDRRVKLNDLSDLNEIATIDLL